MYRKKGHTKKPDIKKIRKLLPLFGIVSCLFIVLTSLLLYIGKIDKMVLCHSLFEPYPKIEAKATIKDTVVDNILVEVGEKVRKWQALMCLKDQEQIYERIEQLKERLKLANIDLERLRRLSDKGYVATRDREEAGLKIKILAQDLKALQKRVKALVIAAPSTGTVVGILVKAGDQVDIGQELVILACSEERAVRIWIKEEDSAEVKLGQKVRIYSRIFYYRRYGVALGKIMKIEPYPNIKDGKNYVEAVAQITESPFPIKVGSHAEARIIIKRSSILKLLFRLE
ncbi:MAG: HlyD family efflux transporter periplasmic adaptor subunit [Candidatus Omnitrophica bacterium]|nr:HlyD family efflux transporter periplasmic adaptor subunit [Candidatus Omnitrophota bacterium]